MLEIRDLNVKDEEVKIVLKDEEVLVGKVNEIFINDCFAYGVLKTEDGYVSFNLDNVENISKINSIEKDESFDEEFYSIDNLINLIINECEKHNIPKECLNTLKGVVKETTDSIINMMMQDYSENSKDKTKKSLNGLLEFLGKNSKQESESEAAIDVEYIDIKKDKNNVNNERNDDADFNKKDIENDKKNNIEELSSEKPLNNNERKDIDIANKKDNKSIENDKKNNIEELSSEKPLNNNKKKPNNKKGKR